MTGDCDASASEVVALGSLVGVDLDAVLSKSLSSVSSPRVIEASNERLEAHQPNQAHMRGNEPTALSDVAPVRARAVHRPPNPPPRPRGAKQTKAEREGEEDAHSWDGDALIPLSLSDAAAASDEPAWVFALRWTGKGSAGAGAVLAQLQAQPEEPRLASDGTPLRAQHRRTPFSGDVSSLAASARRAVAGIGRVPGQGHRRAAST